MKYYGTPLAKTPAWSTNWTQSTRIPRGGNVADPGPVAIYPATRPSVENESPTEEEKGTVQARINMQKLALFLAGR